MGRVSSAALAQNGRVAHETGFSLALDALALLSTLDIVAHFAEEQ